MKFISKNANLRIVLRPGIPANQLAGVASQPGVYVKFSNGVVDIKDEDMVKKMHDHPGFNLDFIAVDDSGEDPFAYNRQESEPIHIIQDIKYGHPENRKISPHAKNKLDPQIKKLVDDLAMQKVNEMLPKMVEETVRKMMEMGAAKAASSKKVEVEPDGYADSTTGDAPDVTTTVSEQIEIGGTPVVEAPIKRPGRPAGRPKATV